MNKACLCNWCGNKKCVINIVEELGNYIGDKDDEDMAVLHFTDFRYD
jgi:hypothetical protein